MLSDRRLQSLQNGAYEAGFVNQQAADFHLKYCADMGCNLLTQYTSSEVGMKAVDLLLAATRRLTVGIPL